MHCYFVYPSENGITTDTQISTNVFHGIPAFDVKVRFGSPVSDRYQLYKIKILQCLSKINDFCGFMWHRVIGFDLRFRRKERSYKSVQLFTHFSIFRLVKTGFQSCFNLNQRDLSADALVPFGHCLFLPLFEIWIFDLTDKYTDCAAFIIPLIQRDSGIIHYFCSFPVLQVPVGFVFCPLRYGCVVCIIVDFHNEISATASTLTKPDRL